MLYGKTLPLLAAALDILHPLNGAILTEGEHPLRKSKWLGSLVLLFLRNLKGPLSLPLSLEIIASLKRREVGTMFILSLLNKKQVHNSFFYVCVQKLLNSAKENKKRFAIPFFHQWKFLELQAE